jgi:hypothetical protein
MCYGENGTVKFFETLADNGCPEDHLGIKNRIKKNPVN